MSYLRPSFSVPRSWCIRATVGPFCSCIEQKDECIEWQVNYGCQKFNIYLVKIQKEKQLKPLFSLSSCMINRQFSFNYHILQNHIRTNPYLEAHIAQINPSNVYFMLSIQLLISRIEHS